MAPAPSSESLVNEAHAQEFPLRPGNDRRPRSSAWGVNRGVRRDGVLCARNRIKHLGADFIQMSYAKHRHVPIDFPRQQSIRVGRAALARTGRSKQEGAPRGSTSRWSRFRRHAPRIHRRHPAISALPRVRSHPGPGCASARRRRGRRPRRESAPGLFRLQPPWSLSPSRWRRKARLQYGLFR